MTINKFLSKLREAGINASFDEENQRFFFASKGTGMENEFFAVLLIIKVCVPSTAVSPATIVAFVGSEHVVLLMRRLMKKTKDFSLLQKEQEWRMNLQLRIAALQILL